MVFAVNDNPELLSCDQSYGPTKKTACGRYAGTDQRG